MIFEGDGPEGNVFLLYEDRLDRGSASGCMGVVI